MIVLDLPPGKVNRIKKSLLRAGEIAKGLRELEFNFRHPHGISQLFYAFSPRGPSALFWPSWIPHAQGAHTYRQNSNMCKINKRKTIKNKA